MHVCLGNSRWPESLFLIVTLVEFHLASSYPLMVIFSYSHVIILSSFFFFFKVKLFNEKRSDLEEQQLHLNVGLQKIRETVDQVNSLSLWRCFSATSALHETLSAILKQLPYFEELFEDSLKEQLVSNSSELVFVLEMCFFRSLTLRYLMSR